MTNTIKVEVKRFGPITVDSAEYKALRETLKAHKRFRVWDIDGTRSIKAGVYNVETNHLFNNQSNTVEGFRIFDFADYSRDPQTQRTRYGHYIVDVSELDAARDKRAQCGYCGYSEDDATGQWCAKCRASEYLEPAQYSLLAMLPVSSKARRKIEPPTDVLADIEAKQKAATIKRVADQIETRKLALEQKVLDSEYEAEFITLCADRGLGRVVLDNLIYYTHTNKLTFGWRKPLSVPQRDAIRETLADVWHLYDVAFKMESRSC